MALVASLVATGGLLRPVHADDTEVFFYLPPGDTNDRPNVLFILDTGQSMGVEASSYPDFDPDVDYAEKYDVDPGCDEEKLYFGFNATAENPKPTTCAGLKVITRAKFVCDAASGGLASEGFATTDKLIYYGTSIAPNKWGILDTSRENKFVECGADIPTHADGSSTYDCAGGSPSKSECYPIDGGTVPWGKRNSKTTPVTPVRDAAPSHTFYTANYVAYQAYVATLPPELDSTRMEQLKKAMLNVLGSISGVNVALMRMSVQAGSVNGGMVMHHFAPVEDPETIASIKSTLDGTVCNASGTKCVPKMQPVGRRPLGETLYEAYRYYAGLSVDFGVGSNIDDVPFPSVWPSWHDGTTDPGRGPDRKDLYNSPIKDQVCSSDNYIVVLTDGFTEQDRNSDGGKIGNAADFPDWSSMYRTEAPSLGSQNGACDQITFDYGPDPEDPANLKPDYLTKIGSNPDKGEDITIADSDVIPGTPPGAATGSYCVDDITDYMYSVGVAEDINAPEPIDERTKIKTFTIGFDLDRLGIYGKAARSILVEAADRGGGKYYDAKNQADLEAQITNVVRQILIDNSSFTSPSVAVNSFNRTQNLNDLYFSVFKPSWTYRWLGNVKKYKLVPTAGPTCDQGETCDPNDIWDAKNQDAVEIAQSGKDQGLLRFKETSRSFWSDYEDGYDAAKGGAAGEFKTPSSRKIYSNISSESGALGSSTALSELTKSTNMRLANQLLFNVDSDVALDNRPAIGDLISWAYGENADGDARLDMGDPLHSKPAVVSYGGTAANPDVTVFVTTNDGFLHAFRGGNDASSYVGGSELWAFIPRQLLFRLEKLYKNEEVSEREYGLDSPIRTLRYDKNGDGNIVKTDGDRVILYFGMRRGGSHYFAVDVTDRNAPELLWRIGADDGFITDPDKVLPKMGQTWSMPTVARVNVKDHTYPTDNPLKWVLVFGGGYNVNHDRIGYALDTDGKRLFDDSGNGIYMVDAISGDLIWRAGSDGGADLQLTSMNNAIPADVRVIDMSGDGFADRMYAADLGGQVWRFDIFNGRSADGIDDDALVTGGRLAALGNGDDATPSGTADSRRFFVAPDPALITYQNQTFINIAVGSGHREKPVRDDQTRNRAYGIRDYYPFSFLTQDQHDDREANRLVRDTTNDLSCDVSNPPDPTQPLDVLMNVTTCNRAPIPAGSPGWKLDLQASGGWSGEKVLSDSVTFQNIVYMPSYEPGGGSNVCAPAIGVNRLYEVSAATGATKLYWDNPTLPDEGVREPPTELLQGGISSSIVFVFPEGEAGKRNPDPECLAGLAECGEGIRQRPVRTYWRQRNRTQ